MKGIFINTEKENSYMPPLLFICRWLAYLFFKVVCMFLESWLKSYGKRVGNTRYICQELEHQTALAHYQANCWTATWHKYKSPLLAAHVPGSWLGLAICPASFWAVDRQEDTTGDSWAMRAAVTTAGANSLSHNPHFSLPPHWTPQIKVAGTYHIIQVLVQFVHSVTKLLFFYFKI